MNEDKVPYIAYESTQARLERMNRRVWILCIILIIALIGTNAGWIYYESQFQYYETEVTQNNEDGYNNYIGNDGDITNGNTDGTY